MHRPYSVGKAWWALLVFEIQILAAGIDIAIVTLLVHPIESAFRIGDVSFATLTTVSLALGTTLAYYPAGLLADTFRRRDVIAVGSVLWAFAAFIAARSDTGTMLFVARFLAGAGIGITGPSMFSMVSDAFPRVRRAFALSVYMAGISIGFGVGLAICGAVVEAALRNGVLHVGSILLAPWQQCFVAVAVIGILSLALVLTVGEPPRMERLATATSSLTSTIRLFGQYLRRHWLLWTLLLGGYAVGSTSYFAVTAWGPAFGTRHYGISGVSAIALLGVFTAGGALLGSIGGGILAQGGINRGYPRVVPRILVAVSVLSVTFAGFPYMPTWLLALVGVAEVNAVSQAVGVFLMIGIQEIASNEARGQLYALIGLINFIPQVLGATLVAFLASGILAKAGGLGPALAVVGGVTNILAVLLFAFSGGLYERAKDEMHTFVVPAQTGAM